MKNKPATENLRGSPLKMVLMKFPVPLLKEMDSLCAFNYLDRSAFIILAADQLLDYLDRKIGVLAPHHDDEDDYGDFDDEFLEAAEDDDE